MSEDLVIPCNSRFGAKEGDRLVASRNVEDTPETAVIRTYESRHTAHVLLTRETATALGTWLLEWAMHGGSET